MKKILLITTAALLAAFIPILSGAADDASPGAPEKSMEERLRKVGRQLDQLQTEISKLAEQAQSEINQSLKDAKQKNKDVSRKFDAVLKESIKGWKKFSFELNKEIEKIEKSFEKETPPSRE